MALIKSHSNYTLQTKHQSTNDGTVWSRDITTIGGLDQFARGQVPIYKSGNFVITVRNDGAKTYRYNSPSWRSNEDGETWTLSNLSGITSDDETQNDTKIVLKKDYYELRDFAYYGSLSERIRATINDAVSRFPGEMVVTKVYTSDTKTITGDINEHPIYYTETEVVDGKIVQTSKQLDSGDTIVFLNPFKINMHSQYADVNSDPLKYFANGGYSNYEFVFVSKSGTSTKGIYSFSSKTFSACIGQKVAEITMQIIGFNTPWKFYAYIGDNNEVYYFTNKDDAASLWTLLTTFTVSIRPKQKFIDEFYNECDDLGRVLLNPNTTPKYKATFSIIHENDFGYYRKLEDFIFPTSEGGYNINIEYDGDVIGGYASRLAEISAFYDERFSDNLYRVMTHESIKNFDWSRSRGENTDDAEMYTEGGDRIAKALRVFAREFDEIKSYIDALSSWNTITYDERNNLPDYFLTDSLSLDGWDVKQIYPYDLSYSDAEANPTEQQQLDNVYVRDFTQDTKKTVKPYSLNNWGTNYVIYTSSLKLPETTSDKNEGLHTDRFGSPMVSHMFNNGVGVAAFESPITEIGEYAFFRSNAKSLIIPNSVTVIDEYAFYNCTGLTSLTINSTTPPTISGSSVFTNTTCTIYVPSESVNAYKLAWSSLSSRISGFTNDGGYFFTCCDGGTIINDTSGKTVYYDSCANVMRNRIKDYSDEKEYTYFDVGNEFLRRLKINSKHILRHKGTVEGLEMMLGMFGLKKGDENDYTIHEYVSVTTPIEDEWDATKQMYNIDWINSTKVITYDYKSASNYSNDSRNTSYVPYQGLPVAYREVETNGNVHRYLYPNFDKSEKIDGDPYFQMDGGWIHQTIKGSNGKYNFALDVNDNVVYNQYVPVGDSNSDVIYDNYPLYKETVRSIRTVSELGNLFTIPTDELYDGIVCYVENVEDDVAVIDGMVYKIVTEKIQDGSTYTTKEYIELTKENGYIKCGSRYFNEFITVYDKDGAEVSYDVSSRPNGYQVKAYIKNVPNVDPFICKDNGGLYSIDSFTRVTTQEGDTNYFLLSDTYFNDRMYSTSNLFGWRRLTNTDQEFLKINTIYNYNEGNNPHNGMMRYDSGHEYFTYFKHIFKYAFENELFDDRCFDSNFDYYSIYDYGFANLVDDNDLVTQYDTYLLEDSKVHYFGNFTDKHMNVTKYGTSGNKLTSMTPYSTSEVLLEQGDDVTNQIVNNKRLKIVFNMKSSWYTKKGMEQIKYIDSIVLPYLEQMIPSTAIVEVEFRDDKTPCEKC